jgi:hypothetical protein
MTESMEVVSDHEEGAKKRWSEVVSHHEKGAQEEVELQDQPSGKRCKKSHVLKGVRI